MVAGAFRQATGRLLRRNLLHELRQDGRVGVEEPHGDGCGGRGQQAAHVGIGGVGAVYDAAEDVVAVSKAEEVAEAGPEEPSGCELPVRKRGVEGVQERRVLASGRRRHAG